ncbi:MAG TPA: hypothetical protein P5323_01265 [Candidatus Moranbacteria bacterium]|nr:hypothetical protein [Candidatus Moranbacteria bacterium]HRY27743.1 hypothetical protein [Candidatus Moranbacteria bacterium]HSA08540.1 hypothetical protein [Candidatus Moranbacteria bacterium]
MKQKTKLAYLFVIVLSVMFGCVSLAAVAKSDNANKNDKTEKSVKSQEKSKTVNLKNFEKADQTKSTTNAKIHKEKTGKVVEVLEQVAAQEETAGNTEVSEQVGQVAETQDQAQEETVAAIEEVEKRGKVKTFLVGTDYKNLGQLRSSLVHNRNEIRQLTKSLTQTQTPENQALIEAQLATLMQERERIKTVITTNESGFSLFGWVSRFLFNYEQTPINETEEAELTDEVETAIDEAATPDATTPAAETPATTTPTTETTTPATTTPVTTDSASPAAENTGAEL